MSASRWLPHRLFQVGITAAALVCTAHAVRAQQPELVASSEARTPEQERAGFHLPPGFEAQLVAAEPDIAKPMNLAFDTQGRLWVTSSYEYPYPVDAGKPGRDRVSVLSDFGPDGRAGRITNFAEGLNIPIGVLPLSNRDVLVHSIPNIYRMIDDDGDGRADRREVFFDEIGFKDTHGMASAFTWGFDGWIYGCHGFSNTSTVKGKDGQPITMNSGNTYRLRPDGSHIEQRTWGQVNPFGLSFDPRGNLYSCDCHSRPIYQLIPGGYYPSFGKPDDGLGFAPEMMTHDHGSTGIGGIVYYAADAFPKAYQDTIVVGNVVTSRINRDHLEWRGSSPVAIPEPDFLVSDDPWFRPVDIELGPDGALYVADFYNKIIGHYEVPLTHPGRDRHRGRIWRIVYRGTDATPTAPPAGSDFTRLSVAELVGYLGHPNLAVRMLATRALVDLGSSSVPALQAVASRANALPAAVHAAWALYQLGRLDDAPLEKLSTHADPLARVHAMRILTEWGNLGDRKSWVLRGLSDTDPLVVRCAVEALGKHAAPEFVRPLLTARFAADDKDTHLVHTIRIALRDQLRNGSVLRDALKSADVYSEADRRALADVAVGVASIDSARFLLDHLKRYAEPNPVKQRYAQQIARRGDAETDAALVAFLQADQPADLGYQAQQVRGLQQGLLGRGVALPEPARTWATHVIEQLAGSPDEGTRRLGMELAGELRVPETRGLLLATLQAAGQPDSVRAQAMTALVGIDPASVLEPVHTVLANANESIALREHSANVLGQSGRPEARAILLEAIPTVPARLQNAMAVLVANDRDGAEALLKVMEAGKVAPRILLAPPVEIKLKATGLPSAEERINALKASLPPGDQGLQDLVQARETAFRASSADRNVAHGQEVFTQKCGVCHQLGGVGARVGPQLDGIGVRGSERLMEDILDPNRNVDQAFRTTTFALTDGRILSGLLLREEGEAVVLANSEGKEVSFSRSSIDERTIAPLSPMPANFGDQIPEPDFLDLIAYLLTKKEAPKP